MPTTRSRYSGDSRATQDKLQQAAQLAGIADVFGRTAAQAAAQLALQQSLLGGIVRSQQQEARRLARRAGEGDGKEGSPRVQQARARTAQLQALVGDAVDKARLVTRLADTLGMPGTFAGYVYGESGAPAPDHEVRLLIADKAHGREVTSNAKTDQDGYFRMTWAAAGKDAGVPAPPDAGALAAELLMALAGEEVAEKRESSPHATARPETVTHSTVADRDVVVRVQVAAPHGALVLEDPTPPAFEKLSSEFRCYVVPLTALRQ
jgi:hypothetical protein